MTRKLAARVQGLAAIIPIAFLPVVLACLIVASPAAAQSISGASASTTGSTPNSGDSDGSIRSSVAVQINNGTTLKTRFAWNLSADVGVFTTRDSNGEAHHNLSFNVTAPGAYYLTVDTTRAGDMNRFSDAPNCEGAADINSITGSSTGGSLTSGSLGLSDPGALLSGGDTTSLPFSQVGTARIDAVSNGSSQAHTLAFTWNGSTRSNSCEAAVRMGEGSSVSGCTGTCVYPGTPSRTQTTDGHFVTVTLTSLCGNGIVDVAEGEDCDTALGTICCTSTCQFKSASTVCRPSGGVCDVIENCTGTSAVCPSNSFQFGNQCRAAASGLCDVAEFCDGNAAACPANGFESSTVVCRPAVDDCDQEEHCTGTGTTCPGNGFKSSAVICREPAGVCDVADHCTGSGPSCPSDAKSTGVCRPASGPCDISESCDGVDDNCPGDEFQAGTVVCRPAAGVCDIAEDQCDGTGPNCPADAKRTSVCRPVAGPCDISEACDGVSNDCPSDQLQLPGVECRAVAGICDVSEACTGSAAACPTDDFKPATEECRGSAGVCDIAENCTGSGAACPANAFESSAIVCRGSAGVCDPVESCTGSSAACPSNAFEPSTTECRPAAGVCDAAESCGGSTASCPGDALKLASDVCRPAGGVCDITESCTGSDVDCPTDDLQPATLECRPAADQCDVAESCTGADAPCPAEGFQPDGIDCDDTNTCTIDDVCVTGACVGNSNICGDGTVQPDCNEECDDGDIVGEDGCSPTCQVEPGLGCTMGPLTGCRVPFVSGKASIMMRNRTPDDRDLLKWKWAKGERTILADFGDPLNTTNYQLCVYDSGGLLISATAPAGGTCGTGPCWKASSLSGFKYRNRAFTPDGIFKLLMKQGADGKAKMQVDARGPLLGLPDPSTLVQPVTVQVQNTSGICWEAVFSAPPTFQSPLLFKDRAD